MERRKRGARERERVRPSEAENGNGGTGKDGDGREGGRVDCLPFEWKFWGLRVAVPRARVVLTKSTRANSIHQRPSLANRAAVIWSGSPRHLRCPYIIMAPSLSLEIDLLFKVTRVSQCVFTTIRFRA